jgi:hypothetical protein
MCSLGDVLYASFVANGFVRNEIFDLNHENNRDNCFYPYYLMREKFKSNGIELNTADVNESRFLTFELHMDVQSQGIFRYSYLLLLENPLVCPANAISSNWDCYRKVFTWNDDLVGNDRFVKINLPNPIHVHPVDGFTNRNRFCCLISSNKALYVQDERDLYLERVKAIRWFEKHAPHDFDLYGVGWDVPMVRGSLLGKIERRFWRVLGRIVELHPFPSYRGKVAHKRDVLTQTRFAICYENVRDLPGYITEKIFDCFFSGCVPIYWGADNVTNYIPADCFIDRCRFRDTREVYDFIKAMTEQEFIGYQQRIATFLQSDAAHLFSSESFVETVVTTIVRDIGA